MQKGVQRAVLLACTLYAVCSTAQALDASASHKKWVVITSIAYPTQAIKILADMPDWKVCL